jgi:hypothetical protein
MKIIGHTSSGYLVEMSRHEITRLCGEAAEHKQSGGYYSDQIPHPIGKQFDIAPVVDRVHVLDRTAANAKAGAGYLRALAEQLEREIPKWIHEPKAEGEGA